MQGGFMEFSIRQRDPGFETISPVEISDLRQRGVFKKSSGGIGKRYSAE
jgi:hypothetical protein